MTQEEKDYFKTLGARVAQLRRDQALTQVQLADALSISQQMVASYEVGRRRIPVSMLQSLARSLSVDIDTLLGDDAAKAHAKRGAAPKLQQHLERISLLPRAGQAEVRDRGAGGRACAAKPLTSHHKGFTMTAIEVQLIERLKKLPPERLAEVVDFVEFLAAKEERAAAALRISEGLARLDALNLTPISDDEVAEEVQAARRELHARQDS